MRDITLFDKSIIVAAHPDDEVLFFSSVLCKVKEIVFCYLGCESKPQWGSGREKSLMVYPLKNISCIGLDESGTFYGIDWKNPEITEYGLAICDRKISDMRYRDNYAKLQSYLRGKLENYDNVFTHNPWGEYGHCEHVQIYRVIKQLQKELHFNLWYPNYCSNKSFALMLSYVSGFRSDYITLKTDRTIGEQIRDIYRENGCWTWYEDWEWFNEESFMLSGDKENEEKDYGHIFPLNMIKVESDSRQCSSQNSFSLREVVSRIFKRTACRE
jgi:hypothetical protein